MIIETILHTDLKEMVRVTALKGNLFSADNGGNKITVKLTDNGVPAAVSGVVTGYMIRDDHKTVLITGETVTDADEVSITLPASAYTVIGPVSIVIKVGSTTVGACTTYVYRTTTDSIVDPGSTIPSISELLAKIHDCETATSAANTAATNANTKATLADSAAISANSAATSANNAASTANTAAAKIDNMTVAASGLSAGSSPTVNVSEVSGHKHVAFGIPKGDKGDPGKDFHIAKTFASIAIMEAYTGTDIEAYDFAMIDTGSVQDADTGKLYCYEPENTPKWRYIGDLSGAQGIKGETGNGIASVVLNNDYTLTITYTNGSSVTTSSIRGETGATGATGAAGADGNDAYVYFRYSANEPTSDSDMKTTPDQWFGIYSGHETTAPTTYTSYTWYKIKGETGATGATGSTGATGAVPAIAVGTVTTLQPNQSATVERRSGSPDTAPVFDFGIPKGETGTLENVYGSTVEMSPNDSTKVSEAIDGKVDKVQSAQSGALAIFDSNGGLVSGTLTQANVASRNYVSNQINGADTDRIGDALSSIISEYDSTKVYDEGDFCVYWDLSQIYSSTDYRPKLIYKRKSWGSDTPVAETFDSTHWDVVTLENYLSAISEKQDKVIAGNWGNFVGYRNDGNLYVTNYGPSSFLTDYSPVLTKETLNLPANNTPFDLNGVFPLTVYSPTIGYSRSFVAAYEFSDLSVFASDVTVMFDNQTDTVSLGCTLKAHCPASTATLVFCKQTAASTNQILRTGYEYVRSDEDTSSWTQAEWTPAYPSQVSTTFTEVVVPELDGAEEIMLFVGADSSTNSVPVYMNTVCEDDVIIKYESVRLLSPSSTGYDYSLGFKYVKSTNTIGYRQSYKDASAAFVGIKEIWYRKCAGGSSGGGGGVQIDDTAGSGDTDVAYSADKITTLISGKSDLNHTHAATDIDSGTLPLGRGGTGQTSTGSTATVTDIAEAESGVSVTTAQYAWWGKVAMVRLVVKKTASVTSGTTSLCELVSGKRPKYNTGAVCLTSGLIAQVLSSGRVQVTGSISANSSITILATYILA